MSYELSEMWYREFPAWGWANTHYCTEVGKGYVRQLITEIERLRAEVERWKNTERQKFQEYVAEIDRMREENDWRCGVPKDVLDSSANGPITADQIRIERLQEELENERARGIHTCHDGCQRIECVQRRRIAELEGLLQRIWDTVPCTYDGPDVDVHAAVLNTILPTLDSRETKP